MRKFLTVATTHNYPEREIVADLDADSACWWPLIGPLRTIPRPLTSRPKNSIVRKINFQIRAPELIARQ